MIHQYFNFDNLIDNIDRDAMMNDIDYHIAQGNYFENSPKFQTNVNILGLPGQHWTKLKMSFLFSVFTFLGKEVQIKNVQSWSYRTSLKFPENRNKLWHHHNHNPNTTTISGVYYCHIPKCDDFDSCGTEFAPSGPEHVDSRIMIAPRVGQWLIYNGDTWHRPGILQSTEDRYIIAADLEY